MLDLYIRRREETQTACASKVDLQLFCLSNNVSQVSRVPARGGFFCSGPLCGCETASQSNHTAEMLFFLILEVQEIIQ